MKEYLCKKCGNQIPTSIILSDGRMKKRSKNRQNCYNCIEFGSNKPKPLSGKTYNCLKCFKDFIYERGKGSTTKYCKICLNRSARQKRKKRAIQYLGGKCFNCGYAKCDAALHFHHLNRNTKLFELSSKYCLSWQKWQTELDKCIILCANCHTELENRANQN